MKPVISASFCLLIVVSATILVFAKGTTTRITVNGAELQKPIEISDPAILKSFNVWSGPWTYVNGVEGKEGFVVDGASGVVTERPRGLRDFELSFYVRYANRSFGEQADELAYIVLYSVDPVTGQGYVYLPGKGDERYRLNTKAIYRGCKLDNTTTNGPIAGGRSRRKFLILLWCGRGDSFTTTEREAGWSSD